MAALLGFIGCGGSGSDSANTAPADTGGTVLIALTHENANGSTRSLGLRADGAWDGDGNEFTARVLGVHLPAN
ncbi:MAG: hypothetical protein Q8N51_09125 [Gammaproteobacteria bacterium]|nr:hypothetical protein [Gammaproteobacteria bacterium]